MKVLFVLFSLFSFVATAASPLDIPQSFKKDGYEVYACEYAKNEVGVALYEVDTTFRALAPGLKPDVCFSEVRCARQKGTEEPEWAELLISCDANLGSTCPSAMECGARGSAVLPLLNDKPPIQTRADAYLGYVDAPSTEIPTSFTKGADVYTSCQYLKQRPALLKVIKDPEAKWNPSVCMGLTSCSGANGLQGKGTAFCAANPDDSCPTAMECMTRRHDFFTGFNPKPRVLTSRVAKDEMTTQLKKLADSLPSLEKAVTELEKDSNAGEKLEEARAALRKVRGQEAFYKLALENWVSN